MAGNGLRQGRSQGMDGYTGNMIEFPIDPANTNLMFMGDPVVINGGYVEDAAGNTPGDIAAGAILGVFMGWRDKGSKARIGGNDSPFAQYWSGAAGTNMPVAHVSMPPHNMFWVKGRAGDVYAQTDVGARYLLEHQAGNPNTGSSAVSLGTADAAGPVQLHRIVDLPNNTWDSDEPILEVVVVAQQGTASDVA